MKRDKNQRSKQSCQEFCWKVHDRAKSFVLRSYTMLELFKMFLLVSSPVQSKQKLCFGQVQVQKCEQKPTTKKFLRFPNHSSLLTMYRQKNEKMQLNRRSNSFRIIPGQHSYVILVCLEVWNSELQSKGPRTQAFKDEKLSARVQIFGIRKQRAIRKKKQSNIFQNSEKFREK